jgi:hypothetical protein
MQVGRVMSLLTCILEVSGWHLGQGCSFGCKYNLKEWYLLDIFMCARTRAHLVTFDVKYELCSFLCAAVCDFLGTYVLTVVYDVAKFLSTKKVMFNFFYGNAVRIVRLIHLRGS